MNTTNTNLSERVFHILSSVTTWHEEWEVVFAEIEENTMLFQFSLSDDELKKLLGTLQIVGKSAWLELHTIKPNT